MENKYKILALFGKSAAGKDTILKWLAGNNTDIFHPIVSWTTRPKRENEIEDVDYHYVDGETFYRNLYLNNMLESTVFRGWYYGTPLSALDKNKINLGVFNIEGITEIILKHKDIDILPVYIDCYDKIRLKRALDREENVDCMEVCRRYCTDEEDFKNIPFNYAIFDNSSPYDDYFGILNIPEVKTFIRT